jgi:hypothetical protein
VTNLLPGSRVDQSLADAALPGSAEAHVRKFDTRQIGAELDALKRELVACGRELQSVAPFRGGSFVDDTLRLLDRLTCRIGIIGQVKAGKSSLINALARRPGLLPIDVNPWTTAVTRLHFGRADAPAGVAAQFAFFQPDEWEHLAQGGGHIRELTQRLVPGFEVELLQKHVDAMRRRAEQRLGPELGKLLGKTHAFPALSAEILERYVCAGLPETGSRGKGVYSDIVKAADLFLASGDFAFPTTLIDTPGTNDPFLVRDEITRRALESADIYVVMLTTRQALSSADVALLRILRGLHKERIVVFINRIDELGDVARDTATIVQHVRSGLRREFPTSEIPIVAGSALWAEIALSGAEGDIDQVLSTKAKALAGSQARQAGAQSLFLCSGLPALTDVLASLTLDCHTGRVLMQISRSFAELGRVGQNAARHEMAVLESEASHWKEGREEVLAIDAEAKESERLTAALQALLNDLQQQTDRLIDDHCTTMVESLRGVVEGFAEEECENLAQAMAEGHSGRVWRCDATPLRQMLEERFVAAYRNAEQEIAKLESHVFPQLKLLLNRYNPQWRNAESDRGAGDDADLPLLSPLSEVVALDLDEPWWKHWWTRRRHGEERVAELSRLVRQEFYPVTEALAGSARAHLKARRALTLQEASMVYVGLVELLKEQNRARRQRVHALGSGGDQQRMGELQRRRETHYVELERQIARMSDLVGRLENVERRWAETAVQGHP